MDIVAILMDFVDTDDPPLERYVRLMPKAILNGLPDELGGSIVQVHYGDGHCRILLTAG